VARLTLTLPVLNQGRCVVFLAGAEKRAVVEAIRRGGRGTSLLPAAKVRPSGDLYVCLSGS
jgi:6-phosphogluconolactonase/glucosamine-6-phosphate isomerase/deaminase